MDGTRHHRSVTISAANFLPVHHQATEMTKNIGLVLLILLVVGWLLWKNRGCKHHYVKIWESPNEGGDVYALMEKCEKCGKERVLLH